MWGTAATDLLQGSGFMEYLRDSDKQMIRTGCYHFIRKAGGCYGSICGNGSGYKNLSDGRSDDQSCGWYFFSGRKGRICGCGSDEVEQEKQRC